MSHFYKKPENALRRANELYLAGKKRLGIEILNAVLHARRHKQWTGTHEDIIKLYLLICVDLREKQFAKDGLYQYRNLCQREAPASLETVANYLLVGSFVFRPPPALIHFRFFTFALQFKLRGAPEPRCIYTLWLTDDRPRKTDSNKLTKNPTETKKKRARFSRGSSRGWRAKKPRDGGRAWRDWTNGTGTHLVRVPGTL